MAIENLSNGGMVITGEHIEVYRLLALRMALKLECSGLKSRGKPAATVRAILKANNYAAPQKKSSLLGQYELFLRSKGIMA
jgi:hypothetical protein